MTLKIKLKPSMSIFIHYNIPYFLANITKLYVDANMVTEKVLLTQHDAIVTGTKRRQKLGKLSISAAEARRESK